MANYADLAGLVFDLACRREVSEQLGAIHDQRKEKNLP
jgi:hypothetical protein